MEAEFTKNNLNQPMDPIDKSNRHPNQRNESIQPNEGGWE